MAKGNVVSGTPVVSTKFRNSGGFDAGDRGIGKDTVPGPMVGAPLYNSRRLDDFDAVKTVYNGGATPDNLNGTGRGPTLERSVLDGNAPINDGPMPIAGRHLPHPDIMTKAAEAAGAEAAIGDLPIGVLGDGR
jgi:hypothetical protein